MPFIEDLWLGTQAQVEGEAEVPACYLQVGKPPSSYPGLGRGCLLLMVDECYAGELDLQPLEAFWLVVPTLAFLRSQTEGWKGSSERLTPVPSQRVGLQQGLWEPQELPFSDCLLHALCLNESEAPLEGRKEGLLVSARNLDPKVQAGDLTVPCHGSCQERVGGRTARE